MTLKYGRRQNRTIKDLYNIVGGDYIVDTDDLPPPNQPRREDRSSSDQPPSAQRKVSIQEQEKQQQKLRIKRPNLVHSEANTFSSDHRLMSFRIGESEVEKLAKRIEERKNQRLSITPSVRRQLIRKCHHYQTTRDRPLSKIHVDDLREFYEEVDQIIKDQTTQFSIRTNILKRPTDNQVLLMVLKFAVTMVETDGDEWFHYMDFNVYYTTTKPQYSLLKHPLIISLMWILAFYIFTPIFFCGVVRDEGVCEPDHEGKLGWMSAIYFASATLSTVGYGDVSVTHTDKWKALSGIVYMILANITLFCAFSSSDQQQGFSPLQRLNDYIIELVMARSNNRRRSKDNDELYVNLRRLRMMRIGQICLTFLILNLSGAIVARVWDTTTNDGTGESMDWMTSLYWAVQTTTTIGYGDVVTPYSLRWFQIFYLILSTYFVGQTLGQLASLKLELQDVRTITAWKRRELSKGLIDELQPEEHDDKVDQYEFVVASLVQLNKLTYEDIQPIMNKYRELCNSSGFICVEDAKDRATTEGLNDNLQVGRAVQLQKSVRNLVKGINEQSAHLSSHIKRRGSSIRQSIRRSSFGSSRRGRSQSSLISSQTSGGGEDRAAGDSAAFRLSSRELDLRFTPERDLTTSSTEDMDMEQPSSFDEHSQRYITHNIYPHCELAENEIEDSLRSNSIGIIRQETAGSGRFS